MGKEPVASQTETSVKKNAEFFREEIDSYSAGVNSLDTYKSIRAAINESIRDAERLLDVGNGGVFDYDTSLAKNILAVDLFLESLPPDYQRPPNVTLKSGDALDLPVQDGSHDTVLMVMLLHHLIGKTLAESLANVERAIREAWRATGPSGRLIVVESCVPAWFYAFERAVFPLASAVISRSMKHPPTLQFPPSTIAAILGSVSGQAIETYPIPRGRWVIQYGYKWPSMLTPVSVWRFTARRQ